MQRFYLLARNLNIMFWQQKKFIPENIIIIDETYQRPIRD